MRATVFEWAPVAVLAVLAIIFGGCRGTTSEVTVPAPVRGADVAIVSSAFVDGEPAGHIDVVAVGICGGQPVEQSVRVELTPEATVLIRSGSGYRVVRSAESAAADPDQRAADLQRQQAALQHATTQQIIQQSLQSSHRPGMGPGGY